MEAKVIAIKQCKPKLFLYILEDNFGILKIRDFRHWKIGDNVRIECIDIQKHIWRIK